MPVSGDNQGWKTCVQVYNPAGFSMEFALVRSSPQRFDCVLSIVVWCGVHPTTTIQKTNRSRLVFFTRFPLCWRGFRGWPLEHTPSKTPLSGPHSATFFSLFSAALLSIQGPKSFIYADLRTIGLLFRLSRMTRPRQQKT